MLKNRAEYAPREDEDSDNETSDFSIVQAISSLSSFTSPPKNYLFCTHINISNSNIETCDGLSVLERLKFIDLSHNQIKKLPDVCKSMRTIHYFDVSHNRLSEFPEWVLQLGNASTIKLGNNPSKSSFHPFMKKADWKKVQDCNLENLNLGFIPECILASRYLQHFTFGSVTRDEGCLSNCLWMIPEKLPTTITTFNISQINLSSLDHDWQVHPKLKKFSAQGNELPWIPDSFLYLSELEVCDLSSCGLFMLPVEMGSLVSLQVLNLSFNKLTSIPKSLELLKNLKQLDLYGNKIENIACDLQLLKRLEGCDLWMNYLDPNDYHPYYERLCRLLREKFAIADRLAVQEITTQEVEDVCWNDESGREGYYSDQEDNDSGREDTMFSAEASSNQDVSKSGHSCDESWDEPFECPEPSESFDLGQVRTELECFLPAAQHATTHVSAPNAFPLVPGQFDDD